MVSYQNERFSSKWELPFLPPSSLKLWRKEKARKVAPVLMKISHEQWVWRGHHWVCASGQGGDQERVWASFGRLEALGPPQEKRWEILRCLSGQIEGPQNQLATGWHRGLWKRKSISSVLLHKKVYFTPPLEKRNLNEIQSVKVLEF